MSPSYLYFFIIPCQYYSTFIYFWQLFILFFGTNILIQCPVPVPVCCMFFVSEKPNIKRSPNGIKTNGDFFLNIYDFLEVKSTRNDIRGGHEVGGRALPPRRAPDPRGPPVRRLMISLWRKKANFTRKIWAKDSPRSELRISRYKGNGEGVESENAETKR